MPYQREWEPLSDALQRVIAAGSGEQQAKLDICHAVADGKISVRVRVDARHRDVPNARTLSFNQVLVPPHLSPTDFDWVRSRPGAPWQTGPTSVTDHYLDTWTWKPRHIELIELRTEEVIDVLCRGRRSASAEPQVSRTPPPIDRRAPAGAKVNQSADWNKWIHMLTVELWQAAALSLNIEPDTLSGLDFRPDRMGSSFDNCPPEFRRRLEIACNHVENRVLHCADWAPSRSHSNVSLRGFADWARSLGWSLPDQFPREADIGLRRAVQRPTNEDLDRWMAKHVQHGAKRDPTIADCRNATGATVRAAKAAWDRLPPEKKLRRGTRGLPPT